MQQNDFKQKAIHVWGSSPAGATHAPGLEPGTKEFFDAVIKKRSDYELTWLNELIPFQAMRGKNVLELGCGAGYDAYEFCRHGAEYTGIDIAPENPVRTKKHLGFYGYSPKAMQGDAENLSFKDQSFDIVFSNGVLHHTPDIEKSFREVYRVLKNEGVFWVIVYHKNSIFYLITLLLADHILKFGFLRRSFKERLSMVESTTSDGVKPLVNVYSRSYLKKFLKEAGFKVESIWVRKLVKEDLPVARILGNVWRLIPQRVLDQIGKFWGWYVIAKAVK
jgi:ubiquinone/menaquinone biosynthesis C-methylase UbiE